MNFDKLPKIELHLHLDCSLSYNVVKHLRPNVTKEEYERDFIAPADCTNLQEYIKCAEASIAIMQTAEELELVTLDLFQQLRKDNVIYAEMRFAPLQHTTLLSASEVVETINSACEKGIKQTGIEAGIILCTLRHFSEEQSMETVKLAENFKGTHVVGFDIAADELLPIEPHRKAFAFAHEHAIPCTAHSGEARGPESVWETLQNLQPTRIGHGVRSIEDERLLDHLKQENIHLEVCPTSNVQTGIYTSLKQHRADEIYRKGISMGINTDGRSLSNVTLENEYASLHSIFKWNMKHFLTCNQYAVDASFADTELKQKLHERLLEGYKVSENNNES